MSGYVQDQVVFLASTCDKKTSICQSLHQCIEVLLFRKRTGGENQLFGHSSSVFWPSKIKPKHIIYSELQRSVSGVIRMRGVILDRERVRLE